MSSDITSDDVLGKDVIDASGAMLGIVDKIFIDPKDIELTGFSVDKGFLKKGLIIGKKHVRNIADHAIFLKIRPSTSMKGMQIMDSHGAKIGIVHQVVLEDNRNTIKKLIVRRGIVQRTMEISPDKIKYIGHNVIVQGEKKDYIS